MKSVDELAKEYWNLDFDVKLNEENLALCASFKAGYLRGREDGLKEAVEKIIRPKYYGAKKLGIMASEMALKICIKEIQNLIGSEE